MADLTLYRALHPAWAHAPYSGLGAAAKGGRWNRKGQHALYLAVDPMTALAEYNQSLEFHPVTLGEYRLSNAKIADLSAPDVLAQYNIDSDIHAVAWFQLLMEGHIPPQWRVVDSLIETGFDGAQFPSAQNPLGKAIVLWCWNLTGGPSLKIIDPEHRLPSNQDSGAPKI